MLTAALGRYTVPNTPNASQDIDVRDLKVRLRELLHETQYTDGGWGMTTRRRSTLGSPDLAHPFTDRLVALCATSRGWRRDAMEKHMLTYRQEKIMLWWLAGKTQAYMARELDCDRRTVGRLFRDAARKVWDMIEEND